MRYIVYFLDVRKPAWLDLLGKIGENSLIQMCAQCSELSKIVSTL